MSGKPDIPTPKNAYESDVSPAGARICVRKSVHGCSVKAMSTTHGTASGGDSDDRLYAILVSLTGRRLPMTEIYDAVGLSRQQYSEARRDGKLITPNRMVLAAAHLGVNPVELLTACGILTPRDAAVYVDERRREVAELFDGDSGNTPGTPATGVGSQVGGESGAPVLKTDVVKSRGRRLRDLDTRTDRTL
jgi:hypothetical protein